jgi:hypothetical protein
LKIPNPKPKIQNKSQFPNPKFGIYWDFGFS